MKVERRILIDAHGAILGRGVKLATPRGYQRASNETRFVFEAWCRHRRDHRLPRLTEVHPGELGALIPAILVVDVLEAEQDFRYRIVGALEVDARCDDPTGKTVREVYAGDAEVLDFCLENYDLAASSAWGVIDFSIEASANPHYLELETLLLPLSEDGERVTQILVYSHYAER